MLQVITGPPRAGKTYYAVRLLLLLYFRWCADLFRWFPKEEIVINGKKYSEPPIIITNIDGLRIPHIKVERLLQEQGCSLPQFLTLDRFVPWMESHGKPVVLLLDEAHGTFPANFRDPGAGNEKTSTNFFFGYHGHYPVDIYLITHSWTDLCQSIAQRAEYQVDAERRVTSVAGEFTYRYLHPKTQEELDKQRIMPDSHVFMTYVSSNGEFKSKQIKPYRKLFLMAGVGITVILFCLYFFVHHWFAPQKKEGPAAAARAGAPGPLPPPVTAGVNVPPRFNPVSTARLRGIAKPPVEPQAWVQVATSGGWVGDTLVAVDLFGDVVKVADCPYPFTVDRKTRKVYLNVPDSVLGSLRPGLWVDSSRVIASRDARDNPPSDHPDSHHESRTKVTEMKGGGFSFPSGSPSNGQALPDSVTRR